MMQNDESTKIIIGLTGGSGSGKSTIGKSCEDYDCLYIDADKIGQEVILRGQPGYDEVLAVFGNEILGANEEIDRRKLGGVVFSNPEKLKILNSISHRHITEKIKEMVSITDKKFIIIDGAVIIGSIVEGMCDYIISVISSKEIRLGRILERDDITLELAEKRIANQPDDKFYIENSDYIIYNNSDTKEATQKMAEIIRRIKVES